MSKPGASTFESLGELEYKQNVHIQLECDRKHLPTDGLVLRGWYTTITLAVYGSLTKSLSNPPETAPVAPAAAPGLTVKEEEKPVNNVNTPDQEQEWYYENKARANTPVNKFIFQLLFTQIWYKYEFTKYKKLIKFITKSKYINF